MTPFGKVISIGLVLLVAGGIIVYVLLNKEMARDPLVQITAQEGEKGEQSYKESGDGFEIVMVYPTDASEGISKDIQRHIFDYVDSFKEKASRLYTEMKEDGVSTGFVAGLSSVYSKQESDEYGIVSYLFQVNEYLGGAHGNTIVSSLIYRNGEKISIGDIVAEGDTHKEAIAGMVKTSLKEMYAGELDGFWLDQSNEEMFTILGNFYLKDNDIVFVFSPYEVAPYSFGVVEVSVPIASLESHIVLQ